MGKYISIGATIAIGLRHNGHTRRSSFWKGLPTRDDSEVVLVGFGPGGLDRSGSSLSQEDFMSQLSGVTCVLPTFQTAFIAYRAQPHPAMEIPTPEFAN
jgi:hypothetical protein